MKLGVPLEKDIQSSICDYLALRKRFFYRNNNTPIYDATKQRFRAMPKYTPRGVSDIIVVHVGRPYFLEVKRENAKQSPDQIEFQKRAEAARAYLVGSIEDVQGVGL